MKQKFLVALVCVAVAPAICWAQNLCPAGVTNRLICVIPQVYGPNGLILPAGVGPAPLVGSFNGNNLAPLNSAIARQSVFLPLSSPSSGITYAFDRSLNTYSPTTDSFGPIYGERAETIGKGKLYLGVSFQYLSYDTMDGNKLKHLPQVFTQPDTPLDQSNSDSRICSLNGDSTTDCAFIRDVVTVDTRTDLKIQQATFFATYGVTSRVDVSVAIPIENVKLTATSAATIVNNSNSQIHAFDNRPDCGSVDLGTNCLNQTFTNNGSASGIGDITLRVKAAAWKGERAALAIGADVRVPTGDSLNLLGAGAAGFKPFVAWSYRARVAPHFGVGFETNGSSTIAGDITTGSKEKLPGSLIYSGGADAWLTKRLTVAFDLVGQTIFQSHRLVPTQFQELGACTVIYPNCVDPGTVAPPKQDPNIIQTIGNVNALSASVGLKVKIVSNLLFTGNAVFRLNDSGLRSKVIPMGQLSYTF